MARPYSEISENSGFFGSISASVPFKSLLPKAKLKSGSTRRSKLRSDTENIAPIDPNIQIRDPPLSASISFPKKSLPKMKINPQTEELTASVAQDKVPEAPDPPVKVVVRIRPAKGLGIGGTSVSKVSKNSLSVAERNYTFDSVFDSDSTQGDVYQLVGAPLVKDALSGYNTSILAYGQTGSGKTYTMWGPPSAMVEGPSVSGLQGIVPRIFQNLFSEIQKEQGNSDGKMINYQCRCSFLEVYDEKIGDLLDPTQRDLEIKDDAKNGFYVENLTEEYVSCYEDVTQILIKESSSKCFGSSKISRISLVDLAGFERNVLDDASRQHVKEGKYIKKSTSQLGRLVNILAEGSHSGKSEEVPYRSSRVTHLLRESFGGNAKLSIICTISPDNKSSSETVSTLRFGLRAKLMKNEPVVNVITEDDVNDLSDQIRQLKEELMKAKSSTSNSLSSSNHGQRFEENLCIDEEDVKELKLHIDNIHNSHEDNMKEDSENGESTLLYSAEVPPSSTVLPEPVLSESPKIKNSQRKSLIFPSNHLPGEDDVVDSCKTLDVIRQSQQPDNIRSSLRSSRVFAGPTESLAASLHRGLQIIDYHQRNSAPARSSVSFSFEHLALKPCLTADRANASVQTSPAATFVCIKCQGKDSSDAEDSLKTTKLEQCKCNVSLSSSNLSDMKNQLPPINENMLLTWNGDENPETEFIKEKCEIKEVQCAKNSFTSEDREALLREIEILKNKLQFYNTDAPTRRSSDKLRSSLLSQSIQLRKSCAFNNNSGEEFEKERQRWMEMESDWISLTDELRIEIESNRQRAEQVEMELALERKNTEELDDVLKRSVVNHARMIEHYAELQEKYNEMVVKHRAMSEGVAEVKRAALKAGAKGRHGARFAKALTAELSALRVERERERELLKKENRSLKIQLKDTAEAVHAAGELLVRLREAEEAAKLAEEKNTTIEEENEKLRRQMEKLKRKHKMEMITMKQYLAESRLPEAALRPPLYREDSDVVQQNAYADDDDQAWRAEFGAIYQEHY
ncbi:hypothetical protein DH2020_033288 [Rehmannia glutinosa]|uniref:Kinesin motor domain-containing protein n=1 Tax=Rehmannia glutinosa TaxID=99300 RepID=A0ABR0VDM3_REHGL